MKSRYHQLLQQVRITYQNNPKLGFERTENNPFVLYFIRPFSMFLTPFFVWIDASANQVTWVGFILGLLAAMLLSTGIMSYLKLGAWFYLAHIVFDYIDGNIARYHGQTNHYGKFLDGSTGVLIASLLYICLGVGVFRQCQLGNVFIWKIFCFEPGYLLLAGGLATGTRLANLYMQVRYQKAVMDASHAVDTKQGDWKARETSIGVRSVVVTRWDRIWKRFSHLVKLSMKHLKFVFASFLIPGLFLAIYTNTLAVFLLVYTIYNLIIFVWDYAYILHNGRQSLNVYRPY
jgi:phosphatidylglycerophosphate synthase